jgi:nitrilase
MPMVKVGVVQAGSILGQRWLESAQDLPDLPIRGGSCIVGPMGEFLAQPRYGAECIVSAEIDAAGLMRAKFDFDVVGHYARPDVFEFSVKSWP